MTFRGPKVLDSHVGALTYRLHLAFCMAPEFPLLPGICLLRGSSRHHMQWRNWF